MTTWGRPVYAAICDGAMAVLEGPWPLGFAIGANHVESRGEFLCRPALEWRRGAIFSANQVGYSGLGANVATVLPSYLRVVEALTPIMRELPGVIVTIDGRDGVGKTTLADISRGNSM